MTEALLDLNKDGADPADAGVLDLSKIAGTDVKRARVVLSWPEWKKSGKAPDPDLVAFALSEEGTVPGGNAHWFVNTFLQKGAFKTSPDGAIKQLKDDDTKGGAGEEFIVDAAQLSDVVNKITAAVTIYRAASRKHTFGKIGSITVKVFNEDTYDPNKPAKDQAALVKGDLGFANSTNNAVNAVEIIPNAGTLFVQYLGTGYDKGLTGLCEDYGIKVKHDNDYDAGVDPAE